MLEIQIASLGQLTRFMFGTNLSHLFTHEFSVDQNVSCAFLNHYFNPYLYVNMKAIMKIVPMYFQVIILDF